MCSADLTQAIDDIHMHEVADMRVGKQTPPSHKTP
jgi:hypothetical protein